MSLSSSGKQRIDMAPSTADAIFNWANIVLVTGGVITVGATVLIFWITGVRERYADERLAANEVMTAKANADAASAHVLTASIENQNIRLRTKLEEERVARLLLEARIAPRRLTSEHKDRLVLALQKFQGQKIKVVSPQNTESNEYALDFIDVFKKAGWRVLDSSTSTGVTFVGYDIEPLGIQLSVPSEHDRESIVELAAQALALTLFNEGLRDNQDFNTPIEELEGDVLEISVGVKPGAAR
ncbi:hypothetical protein LCH33_000029 [Pseudomonas amygdali]|uniref:hypothetical protein n=1 Tax=Pseudomonas amygdali TaxID=47877 RepID=UPI000AEF91DC|nr:hypothetical protein [Pseudomonas amygdali]UBT76734.1 hypothetical protein LCH33_000029 [Pseudomonas amygdali]